MKRLRRASVIAALFLLTSAATASAECAWVLWQELSSMGKGGRSVEWDISWASSSEQECRRVAAEQLRAREAMLRQPGPNKKTPDVKIEGPYVTLTFTDGVLSYRYECLPDTVDPRGPKGK